jgi:hypothetical protein
MFYIQVISVCLILAVVCVGLTWFQYARADEILRGWAKEAGMEVVSAEKRYWRTGPFFLRHSRGQFVYRITVRDPAGAERSGWIRVGGWLGGVLSNKTNVIWDS